jgi:hypothetical protein
LLTHLYVFFLVSVEGPKQELFLCNQAYHRLSWLQYGKE